MAMYVFFFGHPLAKLLLGLICFAVICAIVALPLLLLREKQPGEDEPNRNLVPCPDCGRHVSRLAKACPNCGRPLG
jgi:ribosomal protein S14